MKVIGREIGTALDAMYEALERRVRIEAERELRVEAFEGGAFSNVTWRPGVVLIQLHQGVPTHALPHVFGVALQHVRQRLDRYPAVRRPQDTDHPAGTLVRTALRELILAPEAERQLDPLGLDTEWEVEQRHTGFKEMLRDADASWNEVGTPGNAFAALQYARFAISHPPEMWEGLRDQVTEQMPAAAESGEGVLQLVRSRGWSSPGACLEALVAVRDELGLQPVAVIEDRRSGTLY